MSNCRCGAETADGTRCGNPVAAKVDRCHLHGGSAGGHGGGKASKTNANAAAAAVGAHATPDPFVTPDPPADVDLDPHVRAVLADALYHAWMAHAPFEDVFTDVVRHEVGLGDVDPYNGDDPRYMQILEWLTPLGQALNDPDNHTSTEDLLATQTARPLRLSTGH